jgi:hypothetical protein
MTSRAITWPEMETPYKNFRLDIANSTRLQAVSSILKYNDHPNILTGLSDYSKLKLFCWYLDKGPFRLGPKGIDVALTGEYEPDLHGAEVTGVIVHLDDVFVDNQGSWTDYSVDARIVIMGKP